MATSIRTKLKDKVGLNPPGWVRDANLGYAYTNPSSIINDLNLITFSSSSGSYYQVIFDYLVKAQQSRVLNDLFISVNRPFRSDNMIEIVMSKDMYDSSTNGAIMLKFVKALLAAGDREGKIALPPGTSVDRSSGGKKVIITFNV